MSRQLQFKTQTKFKTKFGFAVRNYIKKKIREVLVDVVIAVLEPNYTIIKTKSGDEIRIRRSIRIQTAREVQMLTNCTIQIRISEPASLIEEGKPLPVIYTPAMTFIANLENMDYNLWIDKVEVYRPGGVEVQNLLIVPPEGFAVELGSDNDFLGISDCGIVENYGEVVKVKRGEKGFDIKIYNKNNNLIFEFKN